MTRENAATQPARTAIRGLVFPVVCFWLFGATLCMAEGEWFDFVAAGDTLGFGRSHNMALRTAPGKPLTARSTGDDAFFFSPPVSLRGVKRSELIVRAAFEGEVRQLRLYFATVSSPRTGEDKILTVPIRADGKEREVRLPVGNHDKWRGTITRYRFDLEPSTSPDAVMRLASVRYVQPTEPRLGDLRSSSSVLAPGASSHLAVNVENVSLDTATDLEVRFIPLDNVVSISPARAEIGNLASEAQTLARATIRAEQGGVTTIEAVLFRAGAEVDRRGIAIGVVENIPEPTGVPGSTIRPEGRPWAIIETETQALVFGLKEFAGLAEWWAKRGGQFVRVGRIMPVISVLLGEDRPRLAIPCRMDADRPDNPGTLAVWGTFRPEGDACGFEIQMHPERGSPGAIRFDVDFGVHRSVHLRAVVSPRLLVGDGAFGDERDEGLFPGLEYLEEGESSSSRLDYHTPEYLRTVPHPKKITVPLMAVTRGDLLLALMWPRAKPEGENLRAPAAGFASPNFVDGQKNHLMALFQPSVPGFVAENEWQAQKPLELNRGERLSLRYDLVAIEKPNVHVTEAIPLWLQIHGRPVLQQAPRDYDSERALCRAAYTDVVWREQARGWNHALPATGGRWAPHPYTFNIQFLEAERAEMPPGSERDRLDQIIERAAAHHWERVGKRPSHEDYYFVGDWIVGCVEARERRARGLMGRQRDDGSWVFQPADERRAELGPRGKAEVGIVAGAAIPILEYALMTGDPEAEAVGLKALEHMKRYVIPRAAQVWEIPVHTPDIMGSARAATAYRLGYLLTGDSRWLGRAEYWVSTGLPFVYFWGHPRWPYWNFATIPVFGATHFRAPNWIGLPVQWCGLVYAEEALRCAELTGARFYKTVADGIVRSAMWQQPTGGDYRGLLPDSYAFASRRGGGPFINPETILRPLWLLRGYDFRVNSVVLARGENRSLRVSARAQIATAEMLDDGRARVALSAVRGEPFGVLVCGLQDLPEAVLWQDRPLPACEQLERDKPGWRYVATRGWLFVNLIGTGRSDDLIFKAVAE